MYQGVYKNEMLSYNIRLNERENTEFQSKIKPKRGEENEER